MGLTVLMRSPWTYLLLVLCVVKLSKQTSPNGSDDTLEELKNLILGRLDHMDAKLNKIKEKVESIELVVESLGQSSSKSFISVNDIKGKIENIELEVESFGQRSSQSLTSVNAIKDKLESIELVVESLGQRSSQSLESVNEIKGKVENIELVVESLGQRSSESHVSVNEIKENIENIELEVESLGQRSNQSFMSIENALNKIVEEKTLLTFNTAEIMLFVGQEVNLGCGVIGVYDSCHWEHGGLIYQLADVTNGSHSNMMEASNTSISNQCGIIITFASTSHSGVWTCTVLTHGQTLTASKTVSVEKNQLIFNPAKIMWSFRQEGNLDCGVIGVYDSCHWEHRGLIYQLADVTNGSHSNMMEASNTSISNQCGIIITFASTSHSGVWTCTVLTHGQTLTASKTVSVGLPVGCLVSHGKCYMIFKDNKRDWYDAKEKCVAEGYKMATRPHDAVELRKLLLDKYGDGRVWFDAKGDKRSMVWQNDMSRLSNNNPLFWPEHPGNDVSRYYCLYMLVQEGAWSMLPGQPYAVNRCGYTMYTLCEITE